MTGGLGLIGGSLLLFCSRAFLHHLILALSRTDLSGGGIAGSLRLIALLRCGDPLVIEALHTAKRLLGDGQRGLCL